MLILTVHIKSKESSERRRRKRIMVIKFNHNPFCMEKNNEYFIMIILWR